MRTVTHTDSGSVWETALGSHRPAGQELLPAQPNSARARGGLGRTQTGLKLAGDEAKSATQEEGVTAKDPESSLHHADFRSRWPASHAAGFPGRPARPA